MRVEVEKRRFTVEEYYRMAETGILDSDERVELLDGEIVRMTPLGDNHMMCVDRATAILSEALRGRAIVSIQYAV